MPELNLEIKRLVIKLPSGKYARNWQYSQGEFSFEEVGDPLLASPAKPEDIRWFDACELVETEIQYKETMVASRNM